jgi:hypothetical protein
LARFHIGCTAFGIQQSTPGAILNSFSPATELLKLVEMKSLGGNPNDRVKRVIDPFMSAVTPNIPNSVRVDQWMILLKSSIGHHIALIAKDIIPNGIPVNSESGIGPKIIYALYLGVVTNQGHYPLQVGPRTDIKAFNKVQQFLRTLIDMGFKQTWMGEMLAKSHSDLDAVNSDLVDLRQVNQDLELIRRKKVDTILVSFLCMSVLKKSICAMYPSAELLDLPSLRPAANQSHIPYAGRTPVFSNPFTKEKQAEVFCVLGIDYFRNHDDSAAIQWFQKSLCLYNAVSHPVPLTVYELLATAHVRNGNPISAVDLFNTFPFLMVSSPEMRDLYTQVTLPPKEPETDTVDHHPNPLPTPKVASVTTVSAVVPIAPPPETPVRTTPKVKTKAPVPVQNAHHSSPEVLSQVPPSRVARDLLPCRNLKAGALLKWIEESPVFLRYESGGDHPMAVFSSPNGEYRIPTVNPHGKAVPIGTGRSIMIKVLGFEGKKK